MDKSIKMLSACVAVTLMFLESDSIMSIYPRLVMIYRVYEELAAVTMVRSNHTCDLLIKARLYHVFPFVKATEPPLFTHSVISA